MGKNLQLLHIDDSSILRRTVGRSLEAFKEYYELTQVESVDEALVLLTAGRKFDVIITDWLMNVKSGLDLLCVLKSNPQFHHLPIFFLTSEYDSSSLIVAVTHGAGGIIKKPATGSDIHAYLQKKMPYIEESFFPKPDTFVSDSKPVLIEMAPMTSVQNLKDLNSLEAMVQNIRVKATSSKWPLLADYSQKIIDVIQMTQKHKAGTLMPISRILKSYHSFMVRAAEEIECGRPHPLLSEDTEKSLKIYKTNLESGWFTNTSEPITTDDVVLPIDVAIELQQHLSEEGLQLLKRYLKAG